MEDPEPRRITLVLVIEIPGLAFVEKVPLGSVTTAGLLIAMVTAEVPDGVKPLAFIVQPVAGQAAMAVLTAMARSPVPPTSTVVPTTRFPDTLLPAVHTFVAEQYFLSPVIVLKISAVVPGVQVPGSVATCVTPLRFVCATSWLDAFEPSTFAEAGTEEPLTFATPGFG
jgi:hypothetical protein